MMARLRIDNRAARIGLVCLLAAGAGAWPTASLAAQGRASRADDVRLGELRREIERRFDVLPLTSGVVLTPKSPVAGVRSVELARGTISIDGTPVTGAELRSRLGPDADLVLQLSYLDDAAQRALAGGAGRPAPPAPAAAEPPLAPAAPEPPPAPSESRGRVRSPFSPRIRVRGDDRVSIGSSGVTVAEGEVVKGNAVAVGGHLRVFGEVQGDAVSIGGGVELGPHAIVGRNVVTIGGGLRRDPGASIGGEVQDVGWGGGSSMTGARARWRALCRPGRFSARPSRSLSRWRASRSSVSSRR